MQAIVTRHQYWRTWSVGIKLTRYAVWIDFGPWTLAVGR
jgi:hypothetical protein